MRSVNTHELIEIKKRNIKLMVNAECELRDSSISFTLFSSLFHSHHFILNLKIKN